MLEHIIQNLNIYTYKCFLSKLEWFLKDCEYWSEDWMAAENAAL